MLPTLHCFEEKEVLHYNRQTFLWLEVSLDRTDRIIQEPDGMIVETSLENSESLAPERKKKEKEKQVNGQSIYAMMQ